MLEQLGSKQRDVKNTNHRLILAQFREHSILSRTDLAKTLSLSSPSISKNVDELLSREVLMESGTIATPIGRRPNLLEINPNYGCVAAIDLSSTEIKLTLSNMKAEMFDYETLSSERKLDINDINEVALSLENMLNRNKMQDCLKSIVVGTPGEIDTKTGYFTYAPRFLNCEEININAIFEEKFNVDTIVENDVNLATVGEQFFGVARGIRDVLYIAIDFGIGSGMILNNELYVGANGNAGEIGLWTTNLDDTYNLYKKGIHLEDYARYDEWKLLDSQISLFAIRQNIRTALKQGKNSILLSLAKNKDEDVTLNKIIDAYNLRDKLCVDIIEEAAIKFASVIKNMTDFLDVDMIVIGGLASRLGNGYLDTIKKFLRDVQHNNPTPVVWSELGDKATLYGAIGKGLDHAFDKIVLNE